MSAPAAAVVLDDSALLALGAGHQLVSALVAQAHAGAERWVYAPAMCLAAATAARPGLAEHLGVLPAVVVADLDYLAATAVGELITRDVAWQLAQAAHTGRPSAEWPAGAPVVTASPEAYRGLGIDVVILD